MENGEKFISDGMNAFEFEAKLNKLQNPEVYENCRQGGLKLARDYDRTKLARKMFEFARI